MSKKSTHDEAVEAAARRLFGLVERTRFRAPGTSADAYVDALILWLSVITEVRSIVGDDRLHAVETVYRAAVEAWLDPTSAPDTATDDTALAERFREALLR